MLLVHTWFITYLRHRTHAFHNVHNLKGALLTLPNRLLPSDHHLVAIPNNLKRLIPNHKTSFTKAAIATSPASENVSSFKDKV